MKKRFSKLTALLLSLTLAFSLALPALAAETPPLLISPAPEDLLAEATDLYLDWYDFIIQYTTVDHPEHFDAFDPDAWFAEEYAGMDKEEYMLDWGLEDEADFKTDMWTDYLYAFIYYDDRNSDPLYQELDAAYDAYLIDTYEALHPGELDGLSTEELLAAQGYTQTLTPIEQLMRDQGITDPAQVRPFLLSDYAWCRLRVEENHIDALAYQERYPEQWAGFDADSWLAREYSWQNKAGYMRAYHILTEEEFREDMFVNYVGSESWKWDTGWWDGGSTRTVSLMANGEEVEAEVTLEDGVSYAGAATLNAILGTQLTGDRVPIRQAAEDAGWDVVWNPYSRTVLLFHREDLPQGDFAQFDTLMNRLLSTAKMEKGQSYRTTETVDLELTAFNSLDGDRTVTAQITAGLLQRDALYELTLTLNAADLFSLMPKAGLDLMDPQLVQNLTTLLRGCKITMIFNGETGDLYLNAPFLSLIDDSYKENTWLRWGLGTSLTPPLDLETPEWNTSDLLYQVLLDNSAHSSWYAYYSYCNTQATLSALLGPQSFTEQDGTLTWSMDAQSLKNLLPEEDEIGTQIASIFKEYSVRLSVDKSGNMTSDMVFRLDMDALAALAVRESWDPSPLSAALTSWLLNLLDFRAESHASGTADSSSGTASFHWKNQFKLELSSSSSRQKDAAVPRSAPPEGAEILDLIDLA